MYALIVHVPVHLPKVCHDVHGLSGRTYQSMAQPLTITGLVRDWVTKCALRYTPIEMHCVFTNTAKYITGITIN